MKILMILADPSQRWTDTARQLHSKGHDLLLACAQSLPSGELPCRTLPLKTRSLVSLLREYGPEVVHCFGLARGEAVSRACKKAGVPLLLHADGTVPSTLRQCHFLVRTEDEKRALSAGSLIPWDLIHVSGDPDPVYEALLHPVKPIKAVISGYYGYGNLGDDAILLAIQQQMARSDRPIELHVLSRRPEHTAKQYGLRAIQRFNPFQVLRALRECDVLISGGGSLLQDKTSTRSLLYYITLIHLAKRLGKPVFMYANGIGPISREKNRRKVRDCVALCDVVTLRDKDSLEELKALGVTRQDMVITGDPVFTLPPPEQEGDSLSGLGIEHPNGVIGISVRSIPDMANFPGEFARVCDRLIRERGKAIVFLIMQESIDEPISRAVQQLMSEPSYIRKAPGDLPSMLNLIRDMDAIIAMRLHTIIFAANVNVPVIGCNYDPKVASMLNILGLPSCGTPADMTAENAYNVCCELLDNLPAYQSALTQAVSEQKQLAENTARLFDEMLRRYNIE